MLNGYAFQQRLNQYKSQEDLRQKEQTLKKSHNKKRNEQSDNYKHRVELFIRDVRLTSVNTHYIDDRPPNSN